MQTLYPSTNKYPDPNISFSCNSKDTTKASPQTTYSNYTHEAKAEFVSLSQLDLRNGTEWTSPYPPVHRPDPSPCASIIASSIPIDPNFLNLSVGEDPESVNSGQTEVSASPVSLESGSRRRRGRPLKPPLADAKQAKKRFQNKQHATAYRERLMNMKSEHGLQQGEIASLKNQLQHQTNELLSVQSENDILRSILRDHGIPYPGSDTYNT